MKSTNRKRRDTTEIFSVFGQIECVAADVMIEKGEARKIEFAEIPESARYNKLGQLARFAVMMPKSSVPRFERLISELRA